MKRINLFLLLTVCITFFLIHTKSFSQTEPVMYFCERYDEFEGEVGIGNIFPMGPITVIVRCDFPLNLDKVTVQYDKYNLNDSKFYFNKRAQFTIDEGNNYISFIMDDEKGMQFESPGFYRVFLLDEDDKTVASAIIEIID